MCASVCVCGTDVVVLCAGLPAGTEDVTVQKKENKLRSHTEYDSEFDFSDAG